LTLSVPASAPCTLGMSLVTMDATGNALLIVSNPAAQSTPLSIPLGFR